MVYLLKFCMFFLVSALCFAQEPLTESEPCTELFGAPEFFAAYASGEAAFIDLDIEALESAYVKSKGMMFCLQGETQGMMAASFHRLTAMRAFVGGDRARVLQEFNRARLLHPGYDIPNHVAPSGHPLKVLYEEAKTMGEGELQRGVPPADGWLVVDGVRKGARPVDADVFIQVYTTDGHRQETVFVEAGGTMPVWGVEGPFTKARLKKGAASATLVSAVATSVFLGLSWKNRRIFDGPMTGDICSDNDEQCLDRYRDQTNALFWSSAGAGALTFGFGGLTVYAW
jgi:hypothetical protein